MALNRLWGIWIGTFRLRDEIYVYPAGNYDSQYQKEEHLGCHSTLIKLLTRAG